MRFVKALCLVFVLLISASSAWAGWVIQYKAGGMMSPTDTYIQDNKMRQDMEGMAVILDVKNKMIYHLNPAKRAYWGGPVSEMRNAGQKEAEKAMAGMKDMLKNMPPEQRKAILEAMQQKGQESKAAQPKIKVKVVKTGQSAKIAGYKTYRYDISADGKPFMELWIAPKLDINKEIDAKELVAMMGEMSSQGSGQNPLNDPEVQALWQDGYPLRQVMHFMGNSMTVEAKKVEEKSIADSMFTVPSDYRKVGLMDLMR